MGSAGHDGFEQAKRYEPDIDYSQSTERILEVQYLKGGHGAGVQEEHWPMIADFVLDGRLDSSVKNEPERSCGLACWLGKFAPIPFLILISLVLCLGFLIFHWTLSFGIAIATLSAVIYVLAVKFALENF